jgi:hypothetical protein
VCDVDTGISRFRGAVVGSKRGPYSTCISIRPL